MKYFVGYFILLAAIFSACQSNKQNEEKEMHLKMEIIKNSDTIVIDTSFYDDGTFDKKAFLQSRGIDIIEESDTNVDVEKQVEIEVNENGDTIKNVKKILLKK